MNGVTPGHNQVGHFDLRRGDLIEFFYGSSLESNIGVVLSMERSTRAHVLTVGLHHPVPFLCHIGVVYDIVSRRP